MAERIAAEHELTPLELHFRLKARGISFAEVARRASSRAGVDVSTSGVRGVVYGYMKKNAAVVWKEINRALEEPIPGPHYSRPMTTRRPSEKRKAA